MASYLTDELLELSKNPKYYQIIDNPTHQTGQENVLCGDSINIQIIVKDSIITQAGFTGMGCALTIASGSKLIQKIINKDLKDIDLSEINWLESFDPAIPVGRHKCVLIAIATLKEALNQK